MKLRKALPRILIYVAILALTTALVFPFFWLISTSFKVPREYFSIVPSLLPITPTLENYTAVLAGRFPMYLVNTLIVSISTSILGVTVTCLAAYSLSRFRFTGRREFMIFLLTTQMFPSVLFLAPMFVILKSYHLLNTLPGLILAYSTFVIPFSTWMLKGYFDGIPIDLEESAMTDGASRLRSLWSITMPLAAPGLATVTLFCFLMGFQEFLFAISFVSSDNARTLPVGLAMSISQYGSAWGQLMAFAALMSVPIVVIFMFMQRYLVQGLTAGAVKG
jgi:multiple sugar transport system permease protein